MAVELVHHIRKPAQGGQPEAGVSDARGASAAVNAARSVRVLNAMSEAEAHQGRVADRRGYFRATDGKANYGPLGGASGIGWCPSICRTAIASPPSRRGRCPACSRASRPPT